MRNLQDNRITLKNRCKNPRFLTSLILSKKAGFLFGLIFIFYLFTGYSPWDIFNGTIKALVGKTSTINLYAGSLSVENDNTAKGWWNQDKVKGETDVSEHATVFSFSEEDSAVYSGETLI